MNNRGSLYCDLVGKRVYVSCANYAYDGVVSAVDDEAGVLRLDDPSIVYETGAWSRSDWLTAEELPTSSVLISIGAIEAIFAVER